ncbi:OsmC family peroxiredoxin [Paracoccus sp. YIM 132242]|uniref:OsmC family peroxiredoxin n=1 Tax=Paracoccus lichenicola TaxID=2665644 RepID=A0A6L6HN90_9RHOB|nr:OsmC family protein [Paracoccus lichenicola]MTD99948.1 OsmC family peroxiredoxin [Paracoccus lichenicola]
MPVVSVSLMNLPETEAALGWAGAHCLIADRPEGRAGGMGLGFNGAQLLALAIGGCFCNDLRYIAHRRGVAIASISVKVHLALEGDPPIATGAEMTVQCVMADGSDPQPLIDEARDSSMVGCSLPRGIPVTVSSDPRPA